MTLGGGRWTMMRSIIVCLASICAAAVVCQATIITVDDDSPADFNNIQAAINASGTGDVVEVQPGTYNGSGNRDIDFLGKAITVRSTNPADPNVVANTIIDCQGTSSQPHRGFRFHSGETSSSILSGLTIINGYGPDEDIGYGPQSYGGAIFCYDCAPTIKYCQIEANQAKYGGAIYCYDSSARIKNCIISSNSAINTGGGITCNAGASIIMQCIIKSNSGSYGGGLEIIDETATVKGCIITSNSANYRGGGVRVIGGNITLLNCTIADNSAGQYGGGLYCQDTTAVASNCVLWTNTAPPGENVYPSDIDITYSNVGGGYSGEGNIDADPCFFNPSAQNYHLSDNSPCINAGDPCYSSSPGEVDIDGHPRIINGRIDMGADEHIPSDIAFLTVSPASMHFSALYDGADPNHQTLTIWNDGGMTLNWQISEDCSWLSAAPSSGICTTEIDESEITVSSSGLDVGLYECELTVFDNNALNSPQIVDVMLHVTEIPPSEFWRDYIDFPEDPFTSDAISENDPRWVKYTIILAPPYDTNTVYFQDSKEYPFHYDFATELLNPFIVMTHAEYDQVSLYEENQEAALGAVIVPPDPEIAEYGIQFVRYDAYTKEQIADMFYTVEASIVAAPDVQAFYFPSYEQLAVAEQNREWFETQGIPISSPARWAEGNVCYSPGWALGTLKYFPGDQIQSAYTTGALSAEDILLTDGVPAEVPFVAGILSLLPSTPSSHVAILAQTFGIPFGHLALAQDADNAQQLVGRTVLICVGEKDGVESIAIKDMTGLLTQDQIDEILALKIPEELELTAMESYGDYSEDTDGLVPDDIRYFGGKAANYGILRRAIPDNCPNAVAVSFDLWNDFLDQPMTPSDSVIIAPYGYVLFWADDEPGQGPTHTQFKLSKSGEDIGLFDIDGTTLIDGISFGAQTTDVSYGRSPDGNDNWSFFSGGDISPNAPNPGIGSSPTQGLFINEFMADNGAIVADEYGNYDDWLEIYNAGSTAIDLGGMYLTDDLSDPTNWMVPAGITGNTLREEIANRLAGYSYPPSDLAVLSADLAAIRNIITNPDITHFSPQLEDAIIAVLQDPNHGFNPNSNIRFRSSTNVEDSNRFSGAGLYDSYSGCLADELDGDDDGPCACDPNKTNERGVFRALRKVFASFYNDNAYLERLRHSVDENDVGMGLLVHHSFPDEFELANGVATLEKRPSDPNRYITLVTQKGAVSVANPEDGSIPEEVSVLFRSSSDIEITLVRSSNLVILGETVMDWPDDYNSLAELLVESEAEYEAVTGKTEYLLDFEYKKITSGGAAMPAGGLVVKQIREIPKSEQGVSVTTPFLVNEPVQYVTFQGEAGDVYSNHCLKGRWTLGTKSMWLTAENLANSFYGSVSLEYVADGRIRTITGLLPELPGHTHTFANATATDEFTMHHLSNPRTYWLITEDVKTQVGPTESPIVTLSDFGVEMQGYITSLRIGADYAQPQWSGGPSSGETRIICPDLSNYTFQQRSFTYGGISITTSFYYAYWESMILTYPLSHFVETTITGLTTQPIVLHGYYSQTFCPGHHNFIESFLFEPRLEPGISQSILDQLEAQNVHLIYFWSASQNSTISTLSYDEVPFLSADIDDDGDVDFPDFARLSSQWLHSVCDECEGADLTGDGRVDIDDLLEFLRQWLNGL